MFGYICGHPYADNIHGEVDRFGSAIYECQELKQNVKLTSP